MAIVAIDEAGDVVLADGRKVKLAFVDVPEGYAEAARSQLAAFVGRPARIRPVAAAPDRWGRIAAHIFVTTEGQPRWLGGTLVRSGLARMIPEPASEADLACLNALAVAESEARRVKAGLWSDARHAVRQARDTAGLLALSGSFVVIEGRALSIGERRERTYINFGRRWSDDTTVTIPKRTWRILRERGASADAWRGRLMRVRGTVEGHDGPLVEVTTPEQIELVDTDPSR